MKKLLPLILCIFLWSCGKSPLLNKVQYTDGNNQSLESTLIFKNTGHRLFINFENYPSTLRENKVVLILKKDNIFSTPKDLTIGAYLWMESMGHGSSPITITEIGTGVFLLSEIYFTMTGDWDLHFTLKNNSNQIEDVKIKYNIIE